MRILTLTSLFPNHFQPTFSIFLKKRIEALARLANVRVVAPVPWTARFLPIKRYKKYSQIALEENQNGLEVFHPRYLVTPKVGRIFYGHMYYYSIKSFIEKLATKYPCDILDVHWAYPDGFAGVKLARMLGIPVSVTVRGTDINLYTKYPLRKRLIAEALTEADLVIAVCKDMIPKIRSLGVDESKIYPVTNGVDIKEFYPLEREDVRRKLGLPFDAKIILSVARLESPKRFDLLIKAIIPLRRKMKNVLLLIVGDGSHRQKLEGLVNREKLMTNVKLSGIKPNQELVYWYNAADVSCLISDSEGWPNVVLESLACGTPVVASAVGGVPEVIHSEEYGFLIKNHVEDISAALKDALTRDWNRDKLVKYAQQNTWDSVAMKIFKVFNELIESKS